MPDSYYITTPIYYVNGTPHLGTAYTSIASDVLARFKRLDGYQVKYLTGTDEHGQKVAQKAAEEGMNPQAFTDKMSEAFRELTPLLKLTNDQFIRTTDPDHQKAAQALWQKLYDNGAIYLDSYSGWYAVRDEAFYAESELEKNEEGEYYHPASGAPVEWVEEPSYFFNLSEWEDKLLAYYDANPEFVQPASRRNEVISFVRGGLKDLSISRTSFNWGVPVPQNRESDEKHVMYVWLDALTNYISALGYPQESEEYATFWPADVHVVGKDILRFHAVYWPAFLMAADLPLPKKIFAHGWWTVEEQKMSKSLGNAVAPQEIIEEFGLDAFRYFLMREVPFGQDGDFSKAALIRRANTDLSNDLGNLAQRSLSMVFKNCEAQVPDIKDFTADDQALLDAVYALPDLVRAHINQLALDKALQEIWAVIEESNRYMDQQAPWALKKENPERMGTVLYVVMEVLRNVAILLQPVMPESMSLLLSQLSIPEDERNFTSLGTTKSMVSGSTIQKPEGVFPRFEVQEAA